VSLDVATSADAATLANLLELYVHELSGIFPDVVLGPDGRFGYPTLPLYWSEPDRRFAFLIRADSQLAGFVLATRGSPASADPEVFDVAEFFVLRRYRRTGVGRRAALMLWRRFPRAWTIRVAESNAAGLGFWRDAVQAAVGNRSAVETRPGKGTSWRIYSFDTTVLGDARE